MSEKIKKAAKLILQNSLEQIDGTVSPLEFHQRIISDILTTLEPRARAVLREYLNYLLKEMREKEASDIDFGGIGANGNIWLRVHGNKQPFPELGCLTPQESDLLILANLTREQQNLLLEERSLDFSYVLANNTRMRYRASVYFDLDHLSLNMRAINTYVRSYNSYNFSEPVTRMLSLAHTKDGLILVTGITGSGKSTTLDAIIQMNNESVDAHVVIIASPVEFVHTSQKCIIRHREVGRDTRSFKSGTIEALRQDPDIIVIGEMRDPETILAALEVADSGHKVFSTLHTSSAVESIDRILGEVPPIEQERVKNRLADVLRVVISQKLVPTIKGGRTLAKEVLVVTPSVKAAIKNNNTGEIYQMLNEGRKWGMNTLEQDLLRLVKEKQITRETALNYANNKNRMQQLLQL
ncbi:MAG: ATPase, T2SS/T4P/T4SS family [Calditrichia bacterium]